MLHVSELFAGATASPAPSAHDLWADRDKMKNWLGSVFDAMLATPPFENAKINVQPYRLVHDGRNLFSVSLLSLFSLRPHDAAISQQDIKYLFCDAFLDAIEFQGEETESFVTWAAIMILSIAEKELLDYAPADYIRDHLLHVAVHDPLLARLRLFERHSFVPLFVSGLFAIHMGGLWPQLFDRVDGRARVQMKLPFKLIEMFLNRFAEEELRFRTVTSENVNESFKLLENDVSHMDLLPKKENVLRVFRLTSDAPARSFVQKFGDAAIRVKRRWSVDKAGMPASEVRKKRAHGVKKLEHADAA